MRGSYPTHGYGPGHTPVRDARGVNGVATSRAHAVEVVEPKFGCSGEQDRLSHVGCPVSNYCIITNNVQLIWSI